MTAHTEEDRARHTVLSTDVRAAHSLLSLGTESESAWGAQRVCMCGGVQVCVCECAVSIVEETVSQRGRQESRARPLVKSLHLLRPHTQP